MKPTTRKVVRVPTPPTSDDENPYVFDGEPPPRRQQRNDTSDSILDDVADGVADVAAESMAGCLLKPLIWVATLPFRLIWRLIESIFD
jgi:hypothetical protein